MTESPVTEAELQAHVDGRLSPERARVVDAWLLEHPAEADRVLSYRSQRDMLRAALDPILEEPLPLALDLRVNGVHHARRGSGRQALVAACAAGLLFLGGAGGWTLRSWDTPATAGTAALAREAIASYSVYASDHIRPVELAADQRDKLNGWFSERLSRPISAPHLEAAGLRLIGGRLVASEHGPAGLYLYRNASGESVAVYVRPMEIDKTDRMTPREEQGVRGWTWADDGLGFGVFGAAPGAYLHNTADIVRAQYRSV
jgi:anti-sigma factor RsiW